MIAFLALSLVVGDRYEPARDPAWLCPTPAIAQKVGAAVARGGLPASVRALAKAEHCESWERGAMTLRDIKRVGGKEIALFRIILGEGPEIESWAASNTLRWKEHGRAVAPKPILPRKPARPGQ